MNADEYLNLFIVAMKKVRDINNMKGTYPFNNTEMRLIKTIILNDECGKKLISTQLADSLGITRSAVSQTVNKLEKKGVLKRIPSDYDRKIAYIELTDNARVEYEKQKKSVCADLEKVKALMGENNLKQLVELTTLFVECQNKVADDKESANKKSQ